MAGLVRARSGASQGHPARARNAVAVTSSVLQQFGAYVAQVEALASDGARRGLGGRSVDAELNGQAGQALRAAVAVQSLREAGTFFTGHALADRLVGEDAQPPFLDPACGAGDLLLAAAQTLPMAGTLADTIAAWSGQLHGWDIHHEFVRLARARLTLLALARGATPGSDIAGAFANVRVSDTLASYSPIVGVTVLLNPPFGTMPAPVGWRWGGGQVARAGVFVAHVIQRMQAEGRLLAILPDVLRSGSRYERWRDGIAEMTVITRVQPAGRFDALTDVDVFVLAAQRRATSESSGWPPAPVSDPRASGRTVESLFDVTVGPVVPHRHPDVGPSIRYLHAKALPPHTRTELALTRGFKGRTHEPPFVVVRRTSRPSQSARPRLIANVITGEGPVAVENHLLVLCPRRGGESACQALVTHLRAKATTDRLDATAARRHLTVGDLRNLPAPPEADSALPEPT